MPNALTRFKSSLQGTEVDPQLLAELETEYADLTKKSDRLELLLITLVRTGWPWDEEGEPNAVHHAVKDGFAGAIIEARDLLGLGLATRITRTEPRT